MPISTVAAVRKQIEAGTPDPVYLLVGDDEIEKSALAGQFADLVDEGLRAFNVERMHAGDWTSGDKLSDGVGGLIAAARTLPMMAPRRIIVVLQAEVLFAPKRDSAAADRALESLEAFLEAPERETSLVLVSTPLDKRTRVWKLLQKTATIVSCGILEDVSAAQRWVQDRMRKDGVQIEPRAARVVAQRAGFPEKPNDKGPGGNLGRLRGEADRLLLYAMGQKQITMDDALAVAGAASLQNHWALANAVEAGEAPEALRQLTLTLDAGTQPQMVVGQLGMVVRDRFPQEAVEYGVNAVFRTDLDLKRSAGDARVLLERLVVELCGARRGARRM